MTRLLPLFALMCASAFAQTTITLTETGGANVTITLSGPALGSIRQAALAAVVPGVAPLALATTTTADLAIAATTVPVASFTGISLGMGLVIDNEVMLVTGGVGTLNLTVSRSTLGTVKAVHLSGATASVLQSGSASVWIKQALVGIVSGAMMQYPGAAIAAAQTAINSAVAAGIN